MVGFWQSASPAATKILKGVWSGCLLYQKPLSHTGFFLALFAEVEQLGGRFFFSFQRKLLVTAFFFLFKGSY